MRVTIYPYQKISNSSYENPYIKNFVNELKKANHIIENEPHKNPLFNLILKQRLSDVYIFHWIENVPDYKHGFLQTIVAILFIVWLRLRRKKIIWFLHNKESHQKTHHFLKKIILKTIIKQANLICTHANEGKDIIKTDFPICSQKVVYLDHPISDRLSSAKNKTEPKKFDILIWGTITKYKGVAEFLEYVDQNKLKLKICVRGRCNDTKLIERIEAIQNENIKIRLEGVSFEELKELSSNSTFILFPYLESSILSSGALMDSLSIGAKVIGPNAGSFNDYSKDNSLCVYTYNEYSEIIEIVSKYKNDSPDLNKYKRFIESNSWTNFIHKLEFYIKEI